MSLRPSSATAEECLRELCHPLKLAVLRATPLLGFIHPMIRFPDVQKTAQQEIDSIVEERRSPLWSKLAKLLDINMIVKKIPWNAVLWRILFFPRTKIRRVIGSFSLKPLRVSKVKNLDNQLDHELPRGRERRNFSWIWLDILTELLSLTYLAVA